MKISLNWIRDFLDLDKEPSEIADILTSLGLEVEGLEDVKPSAVDLDKVFTGRVVACEPIPDTDHLSATTVDLGDGTLRSIVCGAPNVAAGQKVLVAVPGANVFSKDGSLFTIGERKVRGVMSAGMICAEDELGIGHDHSGIMVLPADTALGIPASRYLNMASDTVIEIGLTPNRADATNHLGVARDLAAYLRVQENAKIDLRLPDVSQFPDVSKLPAYPVEVENKEAAPRYTGLLLKGVKVQESPEWLQKRLLAVGQRPINNIVDVTNYVRIELGQPLHAFDADQIRGNKVVVKTLPEGTVFKSLDATDRKLFAEDLIICDAESNPMCIGGVFGGATSGVSDSTVNVFLESAFFNAGYIRRSMIRHNLRTDAAWCFEKGVDPNIALTALKRAALLILELAGGEIASSVTDLYPTPVMPAKVPVSVKGVNTLIGIDLPAATIKSILTALEIGIESDQGDAFTAIIPTNKPDVIREADVVEEVLRVYGLDNVPVPAHIRSSMEITPNPNPEAVRKLAADFLASTGFNEAMSLSLTNSAYYTAEQPLLAIPAAELVYVNNTANQGLDCLRPMMLIGGLEAIRHNQNRQNPDLRLFELGKVYRWAKRVPKDMANAIGSTLPEASLIDSPDETQRLAIWLSGAHDSESWTPASKKSVDFYTLKAVVENLLQRLGISGYQETVLEGSDAFAFGIRYHRGPQELVSFGKVSAAIQKAMDLKNPVFFADFNFDKLMAALANNKVQYQAWSRFPTVRRDLALVLDQSVSFGEVRQLAQKTAKKVLIDTNLFDVFEDEKRLGAGKKSYAVSFVFENMEKTLQDKDVDQVMQQLQSAFESKLNALIRK